MEILFLLIPLSIVLVGCAVFWFTWAVDHGQFDDLDRCAVEALDDQNDTNHTIEKSESET